MGPDDRLDCSDMDQATDSYVKRIAELQAKVTFYAEESMSLHKKIDSLEAKVTALEAEKLAMYEEAEDGASEALNVFKQQEQRITALEAENTERETSLQCYETKIRALEVTIAQHELVNASKSQKIQELEEALKLSVESMEWLRDEQNGAPLETRKAKWHMAMEAVKVALQHAQHALGPHEKTLLQEMYDERDTMP